MNLIEFLTLIASFLCVWVFLARSSGLNWIRSLRYAVVILPVLFLSIRELTQFLTTDELYLVVDPIYFQQTDYKCWKMGFFHSTYLIIVPVFEVLKDWVSLSDSMMKGIAKLIHWFSGFILFFPSALTLRRILLAKKTSGYSDKSAVFLTAFLFLALALPTNLIALKIFNYDLLSLNLSVLAFLLLFEALLFRNANRALFAVAVAAFGAQEKLSGSPFLLLALMTYVEVSAPLKGWRGLFAANLRAVALSVAVLIFTHVFISSFRPSSPPELTWLGFFHPLVAWAYPFFVTFTEGAVSSYPVGLIFLPFAVPPMGAFAGRWLWKRSRNFPLLSTFRRVNMVLGAIVIVLGIFGIFGQTTYWIEPPKVPVDWFKPASAFNGLMILFGRQTFLWHRLSYVAYACAWFINSVPTVIWPAVGCLFTKKVESRLKPGVSLGLQGGIFLALIAPLLFGLAELPAGGKYLNIPIAIFSIAGLVGVLFAAWQHSARRAHAILGMAAVLLLAETAQFGPLYAAFRPIWSQYGKEYNAFPEKNVINTSWVGWGEEAMLAGKQILESCRSENSCQDVRLYCQYAGDWILPELPINVRCNAPWWESDYRFTKNDYYVFNRNQYLLGKFFPEGVSPVFTVSFRGHAQAWVFRGDQIRGFRR
jgi:hypothetical protein